MKQFIKLKIREAIKASEAHNNNDAIQTLIDGKRSVAFISLVKQDFLDFIHSNNLSSIRVPSNEYNSYIVYRKGAEKEARELLGIAEKYGGYLAYNATQDDVRRIGKLLGYEDSDVEDYIQKNIKIGKAKLSEDILKCTTLPTNPEVINYISKFENDEQLLRSGGLPTEMLDRLAFGFSDTDILTLSPKQLKIKWKDDLENVKWEVNKSGLSPKQWSSKINLTEPIDVSYENGNFFIEDGHHRYFAAKILGKNLNINLQIKSNPITKLSNLGYDDFHRCLYKQIKIK